MSGDRAIRVHRDVCECDVHVMCDDNKLFFICHPTIDDRTSRVTCDDHRSLIVCCMHVNDNVMHVIINK